MAQPHPSPSGKAPRRAARPRFLFFIAWCFLLCTPAQAGTSGTILGRVTDPSGAVIPQASVTIRNLASDAIRQTQTNTRGSYTVTLLPPGTYEVAVEHAGFRRAFLDHIQLHVNQTLRVDVALQLGSVSQEVHVVGSVSLVEADTTTLGQVVREEQISQLPLNERNFLSFALLAPGIHPSVDGSFVSSHGLTVSANGAREEANNFLLDGVDNNDMPQNVYAVLPPVDAVQEFKIQSGNSSAEFGRNAGAQVNVVLKNGTNVMHGSVFEFLRNRHLDAKNFFDLPDCTSSSPPGSCREIPRFDRNQFGATLGGPLRRDRLFFFAAYEGLQLRQAITRRATVPSLAQRAAALAAVPPAEQNPAGVAVLAFLPEANVGMDLTTSNTLLAAPNLRNSTHLVVARLDYVQARDTLGGHYVFTQQNRFHPFDPFTPFTNLPGFGSRMENRGQNARLSWTHVFDARRVNEFRFGYNRLRGRLTHEGSGTSGNQLLGFPDNSAKPVDLGFPNVTIAGFDGIGSAINQPQQRNDNTFHVAENLAWNPNLQGRRHQLRLGFDFRRVQLNGLYLGLFARGQWAFLGVFTGNPLEDLVRGLPTLAVAGRGDLDNLGMRTRTLGFYVQDDFHLHPRLTLNLGFRYENSTPPYDIHDRLSTPDLSPDSMTCSPKPDCQFRVVRRAGIPRGLYRRDNNNFAPRVGLAWRPLTSERFVVRAAYGIFYDVGILTRSVFTRFNPPFFSVLVFPNNGLQNIQTILQQSSSPVPPLPYSIDPGLRDTYAQHWNLGVQYEAVPGWILDVRYVGTKGTRLASLRDLNQPLPGPGPRPYPAFSSIRHIESAAKSSYHALQTRSEWRLRHGLVFLAAYSWSKSIDTSSALIVTTTEPEFPQNSLNRDAERALSSFHAKHRLVFSYVYPLPLGAGRRWLSQGSSWSHLIGNWDVAGILTLQSGRPFTVNRAVPQSATSADLGIFDRPDLVADPFRAGPVFDHPNPACHRIISQGGRAADQVRTTTSWFNPCAFVAPSTPRFGTAGRNGVIGPRLANFDMALFKTVWFGERRQSLQARVEFFNLFNHPNLDNPDRIFDSPTFGALLSSNAFGTKPPRQIQIGLKYIF